LGQSGVVVCSVPFNRKVEHLHCLYKILVNLEVKNSILRALGHWKNSASIITIQPDSIIYHNIIIITMWHRGHRRKWVRCPLGAFQD